MSRGYACGEVVRERGEGRAVATAAVLDFLRVAERRADVLVAALANLSVDRQTINEHLRAEWRSDHEKVEQIFVRRQKDIIRPPLFVPPARGPVLPMTTLAGHARVDDEGSAMG